MNEKPHQENLRKGRFSKPGQFYTITKCCYKKYPYLIPDTEDLSSGEYYFKILYETIDWLTVNNHIFFPSVTMMPNHFHILFQLGNQKSLPQVMESLCKFTAKKYNIIKNTHGAFWQTGYYDHAIRKNESVLKHINYILNNPTRKGLVESRDAWPYKIINYPPILV
jgi:REP-associated tyrosine transposase